MVTGPDFEPMKFATGGERVVQAASSAKADQRSFLVARSYTALGRLIGAALIAADPWTKVRESAGQRGRASMLWAAGVGREAYDPETISMLTTVLERAVAALPRQDRTQERKTQLASSILSAAARGERDPLLLYATALGGGPWEPAIGEAPASQPIRSSFGQTSRIA